MAKSVAADMKLPPAEREAELAKRRVRHDAMGRVKKEAAEREEGNAAAMQDPKKKAMFDMMAEQFPDVPVTFKKDSSWREQYGI